MSPRVHVLAPVHNRRAVTEKFIRCLLAQSHADWHLLLIDDGSTDGTGEMARALVPQGALTMLRGSGNWWWAGSLHQAYLWLKRHGTNGGDLVVTMNDDTEFGPDFFANAVQAIRPHSLMLARCFDPRGKLDEVGVRFDWAQLMAFGVIDPAEVNCFSTRGLFLHVDDFLALGGFYPRLLPHYLSDYEFSLRAHRRGLTLISTPEVFLRYDDDPALTGIRSTQGLSTLEALRKCLSIRSTANPVYWSSFVILGSPLRYLPQNLSRVWWRFLGPVRDDVRRFFAPVRQAIAPVRHFLGRVKRKIKREWSARRGATR
jgi:hypothetical protein